MKRTILSGILAALLATAAHAGDKPNLVTVLTAPDAQTQLMSMVLTMQAMQQGSKTHVLLCGPAGDLALKDAPASATAPQKPKGMSPQGLMQKIMQGGAALRCVRSTCRTRALARTPWWTASPLPNPLKWPAGCWQTTPACCRFED
jgi:hypothetical protein